MDSIVASSSEVRSQHENLLLIRICNIDVVCLEAVKKH